MRFQASGDSHKQSKILYVGLTLLISFLCAGCRALSNDTARVKIIFIDPNPAHRVEDVTVFVGLDKIFWGKIQANGVKSAILDPGSTEDWQLTMFYKLDGNKKIWESQRFPAGKGYRIEIKIDAQGAVADRHCYLPCSLD
jgi:hypothetical protein